MRLDGFAPIASGYGVDLATDRASACQHIVFIRKNAGP
jgi:hypothetical protein